MNDTGSVIASDVNPSDGATVKETPEVTQGTESVASENGEQAGGSQEPAEGGSAEGQDTRRRGPSKLDTIRELRAKLRDQSSRYDSELGTVKSQLEELRGRMDNRGQDPKPRKTFFEAPDEVLDERLNDHLQKMEERLAKRWDEKQTVSQETHEWKQETSEAAKLIQSYKGILPEDISDIEEIVRSTSAMAQLRPMDRAKYALYLWREEKGITDKSDLKAKASSFTGAPPAAGGKRQWTESEMERELKRFPPDPKGWSDSQKKEFDALDKEFQYAYAENRVRK